MSGGIDTPQAATCKPGLQVPTPDQWTLAGYCNDYDIYVGEGLETLHECAGAAHAAHFAVSARYRILRHNDTDMLQLLKIPLDATDDPEWEWTRQPKKPNVVVGMICYHYNAALYTKATGPNIVQELDDLKWHDRVPVSVTVLYDDGTTRVLTPDEARQEAAQ
jgi:hypothetical protein